ncbi:alcohol dehydrogenase catalytic domain-containing protein [Gordonia sp. CPCC 206044]|uniref:zinc-dependent alcohol dehydrogenase n=1 Tax=Gordonia sp. CPCC 206044 TaxID=3140793 RepID=UPI003AF3C4D2
MGVATAANALPALRVALERAPSQRLDRLKSAAGARGRARRSAPATMRALVAGTGGDIRWRDVPRPPPPGPRSAVVHPIAVATCDLDRPMALGATPFLLPFHFGHECVAVVVEVGDAVASVRPGDKVVVPFQISCGSCEACRAGLTANCSAVPPISMYGFGLVGGHWGGAYSDLVAVPYADGMLVPLPEDIDPATAASVADNVADGYRAVAPYLPDILARQPDAAVVVLAELGRRLPFSSSVGLYAGLVARALGASNVHFVDRRPHVRRHAEAIGLQPHHPGELSGIARAPLVVDTSCTTAGVGAAVKRTAPDGICVSLASLARTSKLPTALMYGRNITFHLGRSHARANIPAVLDLMRSGALRPELVTSHLGALDNADTMVREHMLGEATKTIVVE